MQLGMIGLGRMGANMVRRLSKGGQSCVVFDLNAANVKTAGGRRAAGVFVARRFRREARRAPRHLDDGACGGGRQHDRATRAASRGRRHSDRRRQFLLHRRHPPRPGTCGQGHPLRRRRHQRRRVGTGARLLPDDRRRSRGGRAPGSDLQDARAGTRHHRPHPGTRRGGKAGAPTPPKKATCIAAPSARATSSRWFTTASSTA